MLKNRETDSHDIGLSPIGDRPASRQYSVFLTKKECA